MFEDRDLYYTVLLQPQHVVHAVIQGLLQQDHAALRAQDVQGGRLQRPRPPREDLHPQHVRHQRSRGHSGR